ncbi:hypothetical protein BS17DRAFT_776668 [Gyrodon lividus]|nr:hypothetical protein BS17DRAFT_776668 [Gyrodon lividus]
MLPLQVGTVSYVLARHFFAARLIPSRRQTPTLSPVLHQSLYPERRSNKRNLTLICQAIKELVIGTLHLARTNRANITGTIVVLLTFFPPLPSRPCPAAPLSGTRYLEGGDLGYVDGSNSFWYS